MRRLSGSIGLMTADDQVELVEKRRCVRRVRSAWLDRRRLV